VSSDRGVSNNLPVHPAEAVESLIESVGAKVQFLPPYSPDLSPIEFCRSTIKVILRSEAARTSNVLDEAITKAINAITDENALKWFHHCSLFFEPIRELIFVVDLMANSCKLKN